MYSARLRRRARSPPGTPRARRASAAGAASAHRSPASSRRDSPLFRRRIRSGARACRGPRTWRQTASSAPRAKRSACPSSPRLSEPDMFHSFYHSIHILRSLWVSQSLLPQEQIKFHPFSPATCASEKIPLGSQTCERSECAAASRIPSNETLNGVGFV